MKYFLKISVLHILFSCILPASLFAQDDLEKLLEETTKDPTEKEYVTATFKGTKIVNGQSVATPSQGVLQFHIQHRFGTVNSGSYNFYGLDDATIRLGLDYGITDRLAIGVGRNSLGKTFDSYLKYKLIKQSTGKGGIPISVVLYSDAAASTERQSTGTEKVELVNRLSYANQILIARKFNDKFSLQLAPTYIHRNVVATPEDENDVFAMGAAGRVKVTKRFAITGEYYYLLPGQTADDFNNSFSLGFDLETGGHVFQIHVTNSAGMIESQFIPGTLGQWEKGDIRIGFNISRVFTIVKPKQPKG